MTRLLVGIILGYLIAGTHYVWRDLSRPVMSRPAYARAKTASEFWFGAAIWFPATVLMLPLNSRRFAWLKETLVSWGIFAAIILAVLYLPI